MPIAGCVCIGTSFGESLLAVFDKVHAMCSFDASCSAVSQRERVTCEAEARHALLHDLQVVHRRLQAAVTGVLQLGGRPNGAVGAAGARCGIPRHSIMQRQAHERRATTVRLDGLADERPGLLLNGPAGLGRLLVRHVFR